MRVIIGNVQSPANPLQRAVYFVLGALALVVSLFFGAIVLTFVIGFILIVGSIAAIRFWWFRRKLEQAASGSAHESRQHTTGGRVIEGEFSEEREQRSDRNG